MKSLLIGVLVFCTLFVNGQQTSKEKDYFVDISNDLYQMHQKENSEKNVIEFFKKSNLDFISDTIYAVFVPPMVCSRCEGSINPFIYKLKKYRKNAEVVIIAFYDKPKALEQYFNERKYATNKIITAVTNDFLNNFFFTSGDLSVPFYTKFNIAKGDLLVSKTSLGINVTDNLVKKFIEQNDVMPKYTNNPPSDSTYHQGMKINNINNLDSLLQSPFKAIDISEDNNHPISDIQYPYYLWNNDTSVNCK